MNEGLRTVMDARKELREAQETFDRVPGYQNAIALANAKKAMAHLVDAERGAWMVIDGSSGLAGIPPLEVALAALWEVHRQTVGDADTVNGGHDAYIHKVATQALITLGEIDEGKEV